MKKQLEMLLAREGVNKTWNLSVDEFIEEILKIINEKGGDILKIHYDSTEPMDVYFTGTYNGIELTIACLTGRLPVYKDCPLPDKHEQTTIRASPES